MPRRPGTSTLPSVKEDNVHQESRERSLSMGNRRVCFYSKLQEDRLKDLRSEQSLACGENNQLKTENRQINRSEEHVGLNKDDHDANENMADCCVELEDIAMKQQEEQINSKQETRF